MTIMALRQNFQTFRRYFFRKLCGFVVLDITCFLFPCVHYINSRSVFAITSPTLPPLNATNWTASVNWPRDSVHHDLEMATRVPHNCSDRNHHLQ